MKYQLLIYIGHNNILTPALFSDHPRLGYSHVVACGLSSNFRRFAVLVLLILFYSFSSLDLFISGFTCLGQCVLSHIRNYSSCSSVLHDIWFRFVYILSEIGLEGPTQMASKGSYVLIH